jgi:hypothetical protein
MPMLSMLATTCHRYFNTGYITTLPVGKLAAVPSPWHIALEMAARLKWL